MITVLNQVDEPIKAARKTEGSTRFYTCDDAGNWSAITTGDDKSFGLREARKMKAEGKVVVPSVTSIFSVLAKPQLDVWKQENVAKACWEQHNDSNAIWHGCDEWTDAALATASQASKGAMNLGTAIHLAIEQWCAGQDYDAAMKPYVDAVAAEWKKRDIGESVSEVAVGDAQRGYAGRVDNFSRSTFRVRDFKSRSSKGKKVPTYPTDVFQGAAYGAAIFKNQFFGYGTFEVWGISTDQPGLVTVTEYTGQDLIDAYETFLALTTVWRGVNRYDGRVV